MDSSTHTTDNRQLARELVHPEAAERMLADLGLKAAWYGAQIWRLWLPRERASQLLADLDRLALTPRLAGVFEARGVTLYLWPRYENPDPAFRWLLRTYSAGAVLVEADAVRCGGAPWAAGRALRRLLRPRVELAREIGA